jgi:hypothetical protein
MCYAAPMIENHRRVGTPAAGSIAFREGTFVVDAALLGELLNLPPSRVPGLMREGAITSVCERGVDEHDGEFRLTFFHANRRARVSTDLSGQILRRSVIDFGDRPMPRALHRTGG